LFAGDYDQAILTQQPGNVFSQVILASALAPADADGVFEACDVAKTLNLFAVNTTYNMSRVQQYLAKFTSDRRGRILIRVGAKGESRFRFSDALMQPFVIIKAINDKKLDWAFLRERS
jgi:hypothetical protein